MQAIDKLGNHTSHRIDGFPNFARDNARCLGGCGIRRGTT